jgi:hypothetical protein
VSRARGAIGWLVVVFVALGIASSALGGSTTFVVRYDVPSECPGADWFESRVRFRTSLAEFASKGTPLAVAVKHDADGYHARLESSDASGNKLERAVEGETCEEAIDALALVTALAIDPNAKLTVVEAPTSASASASVAPPPKSPPTDVSIAAPPITSDAPAWSTNVGASLDAVTAIAPTLSAGGDAFVEVDSRSSAALAPSFRLAARYVTTAVGSSTREADFARATLHADACPLRIGDDVGLSARTCVTSDVGLLHVRGVDVANPASANRFWLDVGVLLRARWSVTSYFVEASAGLFAPLTKDTYVFTTPRIVVHEIPSFAGIFSLGGGVRFW